MVTHFGTELIDKKTKLIDKKSTQWKSTNKLRQNMEQGNVVKSKFWISSFGENHSASGSKQWSFTELQIKVNFSMICEMK